MIKSSISSCWFCWHKQLWESSLVYGVLLIVPKQTMKSVNDALRWEKITIYFALISTSDEGLIFRHSKLSLVNWLKSELLEPNQRTGILHSQIMLLTTYYMLKFPFSDLTFMWVLKDWLNIFAKNLFFCVDCPKI